MNLEIVLWPDPILLTGTKPIEVVDEQLRLVVGEMRRVLFEQRGVGLAAPQVGVPLRLMLVCPSGAPGDETVVLNPELVAVEGLEEAEEGCLSFPGLYGDVPRAVTIEVRYQDLEMRARQMVLDGWVARIFQHELDHLNGEVFVDKMVPASREKIAQGLEELKQQYAEASA